MKLVGRILLSNFKIALTNTLIQISFNTEYVPKFQLFKKSCFKVFLSLDPLVQYLQQFYDGHIFGWSSLHDLDANSAERLRQIQQRRRNGRHGIMNNVSFEEEILLAVLISNRNVI
jgi:hypothetical protein